MNPFMTRLATALGLQIKQTTTSRIAESQVADELPRALAKSALSEPVRAAILATPPVNVSLIPVRIGQAKKIEDACAAAAKSARMPMLERLSVAYVIAGTPIEHVQRDMTDFLADRDSGVSIDTALPHFGNTAQGLPEAAAVYAARLKEQPQTGA
jgi:hypothetical protein